MKPAQKRKIDAEEMIKKGYHCIIVHFDKNSDTTSVEVHNKQNFHITDAMYIEMDRCLLPDVLEFYST